MNQKTALILGASGQDGAHLAEQLLRDGWSVVGSFRRGSSSRLWRLQELELVDRIKLVNLNVEDPHQILDVVTRAAPEHIYHLAGASFVADSYEQPRASFESNTIGTLNVLEAMRLAAPKARLFFASSSEIFAGVFKGVPLNEQSAYHPINPYGISKLAAHHLVEVYRERHNLFACVGTLFNHEGPLRARNYVTRKISYNMARLKFDGGDPLELGSLDAQRDWGYAPDYTRAMQMLLANDTPADAIFATGKGTSVRDFLSVTAKAAGFSPAFSGKGLEEMCVDTASGLVLAVVSKKYFRESDTPAVIGDSSYLLQTTNFRHTRSIEQLAEEMLEADVARRSIGIMNV